MNALATGEGGKDVLRFEYGLSSRKLKLKFNTHYELYEAELDD